MHTPDFYVIRTVTLLEVFTRANIAELIDHGREYASNAIELAKNLKIDFAVLQGIEGRVITLGDIVAHSLYKFLRSDVRIFRSSP